MSSLSGFETQHRGLSLLTIINSVNFPQNSNGNGAARWSGSDIEPGVAWGAGSLYSNRLRSLLRHEQLHCTKENPCEACLAQVTLTKQFDDIEEAGHGKILTYYRCPRFQVLRRNTAGYRSSPLSTALISPKIPTGMGPLAGLTKI